MISYCSVSWTNIPLFRQDISLMGHEKTHRISCTLYSLYPQGITDTAQISYGRAESFIIYYRDIVRRRKRQSTNHMGVSTRVLPLLNERMERRSRAVQTRKTSKIRKGVLTNPFRFNCHVCWMSTYASKPESRNKSTYMYYTLKSADR